MSLYTPVFPSLHQVSTLREGFPASNPATTSGKQRNYVEFLRDVHLFLSTQSDVLSPPSRPNSPMFDRRVQKVRDEIHNVFDATGNESSSGKWTRVSQALKLGCVRGRHWSISQPDLRTLEEDTDWILPDEESEWIEWEEKREKNRRLKGKTNASQQIGTVASLPPDTQKPNHTTFAKPSQPHNTTRELRAAGVPPGILRAAREKVRKWQASVTSEARHSMTSGPSPSSSMATVAPTATQGKTGGSQRPRTLDFTVVKPAAQSINVKKVRGSLSQPIAGGNFTPIPSHKSKSPKAPSAGEGTYVDKANSKRRPNVSPAKDDIPKIQDVPETPYLPPSFPAHLQTSTPLADFVAVVRAKPSPIAPMPVSSLTPPPSTAADPPDDHRQLISVEPHAVDVSSSHLPRIATGKRSRAPSTSLDVVADGPLVTSPSKRARTLSQDCYAPISEHAKPVLSHGDLDTHTRDDSNPGAVSFHPYNMDSVEMASSVRLTPGEGDKPAGVDVQGSGDNIQSPTKSVKSYFSAPDLDESPMRANLLLESPVSPMLSYAQNPSGFLPQITSTQTRKGSPTPSRTNGDRLRMGYSSQFDIERHVDRVSELLEKDVDFDGWVRDLRTVDMSQD